MDQRESIKSIWIEENRLKYILFIWILYPRIFLIEMEGLGSGDTQVAPGRSGNAQVSRKVLPGHPVTLLRAWLG